MSRDVAIVGGGFAGLSAAVRLCQLGHTPALYERRPVLGGRAYSFEDQQTGHTLDNGQHVLMQCCTAVLEFLETIGAEHTHFESGFSYPFVTVTGERHRLEAPSWLPAELGLLMAFLRFGPTRLSDALGLRRITPYFTRPPNNISVQRWLDDTAQSETIQSAFWHPLCLSVMNAPPEFAGARELVAVLAESFSSRGGANIGWATVGLSDLYTTQAVQFIESHGGHVSTNAYVDDVTAQSGRLAIDTRSKTSTLFDAVVLAVPPPRAASLTEQLVPQLSDALSKYAPSPILGINLWFEREVMVEPMLGILGGTIEWVFNRQLIHQSGKGPLSLVVSASNALLDASDTELIDIALSDLRGAGLIQNNEEPFHTRVIHEKQATYIRPISEPAVSNGPHAKGLYIAGDWTDTGFPPTIEGAVRSGTQAADLIHADLQ